MLFPIVLIFFVGSAKSSVYESFSPQLSDIGNNLDPIEVYNRRGLHTNQIVECENLFQNIGLKELQGLIESVASKKGISPFFVLRMLYKRMKNTEESILTDSIPSSDGHLMEVSPSIPVAHRAPYSLSPTNPSEDTKVVIIPMAPPPHSNKMPDPLNGPVRVLPAGLLSALKNNHFRPPLGAMVRVNCGDPQNPINRNLTIPVSPFMTILEALRQAETKYQNILGLSHDMDVITFSHSTTIDCYLVNNIHDVEKSADFGWKIIIIDRDSHVIGASAASKFGGKTVMTCAVFLWSLSTVITPFIASSLTLLLTCRILLGLGEGIGLPTVFNIFAHSVPVEERSRAFGYLVASGTAGQTIAALICPHLPWPWMFYTFGSLGIVWVLLWMICYSDIPNYGNEELPLVFPKVTNVNVRWIEFISHWSLWAIYVAHFAMNWSNYIIMQWLPTYLSRNLGADQKAVSLTAMPYLINSLFGVVSGHFADSLVSRKWTVLSVRRLMTCIGLLGPGIFLLCFNAVNNLLAAVVFVSISMGLCACNSAGHLSNHADVAPNHAGMTFAISNTMATIPGILCGPVTAELVTQSHGRWFPVFALAGCINFVGAVIYASQSSASQAL